MSALASIGTQGLQPVAWSFDPATIALAVVGRQRLRQSRPPPRAPGAGIVVWRRLSFYLGIGILLAALISPIDSLGDPRSSTPT